MPLGKQLQYHQWPPDWPRKVKRLASKIQPSRERKKLVSKLNALNAERRSPAKKMFDTPASSYCASDRNGKRKATEPMETDNEESYENGGGEDKDEEEEPKEKPTRGRPRKAILKDAAKRLKKL
ncbi:hypothetical protein PtA15_12A233 [Puccinia triticina]|uniref:PWWP domain-containing protein n=1 Tax=Puccinia triticina TaxID=208348 RepID=A0ABY7D2L2_9BASI|nr:uncharacterized protein PtA15_12A233 [Puccinia triticina]WAQ90245.1 hypothetical protein PtA15_12A233 [Puccinia triticina]